MGALILACGFTPTGFRDPEWWEVPAIPGKADLDPLLAKDPERVVVVGTDAGLAAVVLRLLRADRLDLPVGFWPRDRERSAVARLWGLPDETVFRFACDGEPVPIPLIRDDNGGVLVGRALVEPVHGEAYCDDALALRGRARRIEVTPDLAGGVQGRVVHRGWPRHTEAFRGRAFQVGCHPTTVTSDGITQPRPVSRRTWYRHTEDLRAITPFSRGRMS